MKTSGYCQLCRQKEIELYGMVLDSGDYRHLKACEAAGCCHPPYYIGKTPFDPICDTHSPLPWHLDPQTGHVYDADGIPVFYSVPKNGPEPRQILSPERRAANILLVVQSVNATIGKPDHLVKGDD